MPSDWCPYKKKRPGHRYAQGDNRTRTREEDGVHTSGREALGEPALQHLLWDVPPLDLGTRVSVFKPSCHLGDWTHNAQHAGF